jgi:hypothetical protein
MKKHKKESSVHTKVDHKDKMDVKLKGGKGGSEKSFEIKSKGKGLASTKSPVKKY